MTNPEHNPDSEDFLKAYPIVDRAKALPIADRQQFIVQACRGDAKLLKAVDLLMKKVESSSAWGEGAALDPQDAIGNLVGESIDGFEILSLLGQGGMGTVYLARQARPRREVALKLLRANWLDRDRQRRFRKETEVLAKLSHPHIASLFQCGTWERAGDIAVPYFAMEYVEGARNIVRYCQEEGLDRRQRLQLLCRVLEALDYGHARGIVHRDLKPDNLLVDPAGHPRVIDFGLARVVEGEDPLATRDSADTGIIGTLAYMAPEQYSDAGEISVQTDVYALGLILVELLCDQPAVKLKATTLPAALLELTSYEVPSPSQLVPGLPSDMDRIVRKAVARAPGERYAAASHLAQDIEDHLAGRPLGLAPPLPQPGTSSHVARTALLVVGALALGLLVGFGSKWPSTPEPEMERPGEVQAAVELEHPEQVSILDLRPAGVSESEPLVLSTEVDRDVVLPPARDEVSTSAFHFKKGRFKLSNGSLKLVGPNKTRSLQIGMEDGDRAAVDLLDGRLTVLGETQVGAGIGSHGQLHIGRGSRLQVAWVGPDWTWTRIGAYGTGELLITDGGQLHSDNVLSVGARSLEGRAGSSSALVSGVGSQIYAWHLRVGDGHDGKVVVTQRGRIFAEYSVNLGYSPTGEGIMQITEGGDVTIVLPTRDGRDAAASIGHVSSGVLDVRSGSRFLANGAVRVGSEALSKGKVLVDGASTFIAEDVILAPGQGAMAHVDVRGANSRLIARSLLIGSLQSREAAVAVFESGQLSIESALDIAATGQLTVRGSNVTCEQLSNAGKTVFEKAQLEGNLLCTEGATVELVINSNPTSTLLVKGAVELAGTLKVIGDPGPMTSGKRIPLISAESVQGEFTRVLLGPNLESAHIETSATGVSLVFE